MIERPSCIASSPSASDESIELGISARLRHLFPTLVLSVGLVCTFYVWHWRLNILSLSSTPTDNTAVLLSLLSTLVEALASVFGISIAVVFLAAQIYTRPQYARAVTEMYNDGSSWTMIVLFAASLVLGFALLTHVTWIISSSNYYLVTIDTVWAGTAIGMFLSVVLAQLSTLDPYRLGQVLLQRLTVRRIVQYNLSEVKRDETSGQVVYRLHVYGYYHGRQDPLAPYHEIVLWAANNRDRVAMSALIRLMLSVVARVYGVPMSAIAERDHNPSTFRKVSRILYMAFCRPKSEERAVAVSLFILTYVVRRAQRLIKEWGGLDIPRQQYILNLRDLIRSLSCRPVAATSIRLCLWAAFHICLSYSAVARYGEEEALCHYFTLANELDQHGFAEEGQLCAEILAVLSRRTRQLPEAAQRISEGLLSDRLRAVFFHALACIERDPEWFPGGTEDDPWRYRVPTYDMPHIDRLIILEE